MNQDRDWRAAVAAAHAQGLPVWVEDGLCVRRVTGGMNNALYRVETVGGVFACKLCVADDRRRAEREYHALRLLQVAGIDVAPQPRWLDLDGTLPYPAVAYVWLDGQPLASPLPASDLAHVLETFQHFHALAPEAFPSAPILPACFHWRAAQPHLAEMRNLFSQYGPWLAEHIAGGPDLCARMTRLIELCAQWVLAANVDLEHIPLRLCRVDPNLENALHCTDGRVRWVDWEFSGWGDPALELADLCWHAALEEVAPEQHRWLRENYRPPKGDSTFHARVAVWDRIIATRWPLLVLRLLWVQFNGLDRVRLTAPVGDPEELGLRMVRLVERAERLVG